MRLMRRLEIEAGSAASIFRKALAKEDHARLARLRQLAREKPVLQEFLKDGLFVGWTKGDLRTYELKDYLDPLMEAVFAYEHAGAADDALEDRIEAAWQAFHTYRMRVLVHCL
jgi:hypothetical protein